jgi:hypothetical protein
MPGPVQRLLYRSENRRMSQISRIFALVCLTVLLGSPLLAHSDTARQAREAELRRLQAATARLWSARTRCAPDPTGERGRNGRELETGNWKLATENY